MFDITVEQRQYQTYILSDRQAQAEIEVVPERGGIITQWRMQNQDLLYLDAERFTQPALSIRGGIPILFPICGNLPENTYTHQGQTYALKQHGFARDLPWQVIDQDTSDGASLTLELTSNEQTKAVYPFDFRLRFTYQLQGNTLRLNQDYQNLSPQPMPFATGLHPYFVVSDKRQLQFEIPANQYKDHLSQRTHFFAGQFDFNQPEIDIAFLEPTQTSAQVIDPQRHSKLILSWDQVYSTLVFWTIQGKDYYCLEPWTAPRNAMNTGDRLLVIPPQAELTTVVQFQVDFD